MKCFKHPKMDAVGVCANCGKGICEDCSVEIKDKIFCKDCTKKGEASKKGNVSGLWWLLPLFFGILGGILAWAVNKDRDAGKARSMLIFGFLLNLILFFVLIVAGILAGWATYFVTAQRSGVTGSMVDGQPELQFCSKAQVLIQRAYYDSSTKTLTLALFNTGEVPLSGFAVRIIHSNGTIFSEKFDNLNIQYQNIETISLLTENTLTQVAVQSLQCRGAQDLIGRYDIQGLGFQ